MRDPISQERSYGVCFGRRGDGSLIIRESISIKVQEFGTVLVPGGIFTVSWRQQEHTRYE